MNCRDGTPINTSLLYSSAPRHEVHAHEAVVAVEQPPSTSPIPCSKPTTPFKGKSRAARNTLNSKASRKRRKRKLGRKKNKLWSRTNKYLRRRHPERLRYTDVLNLFQADQLATRTGRHAGTFITLRWAETALGETADINKRFAFLLNAARIWADRHGIEWTAIAVHENPPPADKPTFNTHILCNIPESLRLAFMEWLMKRLGGSAGAVHSRPRVCPGWEADETLGYMCKGTDPQTARSFRLVKKHGWKRNQGHVPFQRCTVTRNINARRWQFSDTIKTGISEFRDQYPQARAREAA